MCGDDPALPEVDVPETLRDAWWCALGEWCRCDDDAVEGTAIGGADARPCLVRSGRVDDRPLSRVSSVDSSSSVAEAPLTDSMDAD